VARPATNVVANSSVLLSATTPAGAAGRADVVVTHRQPDRDAGQAFTYLIGGNPLLLRDDFSSGTATGWTISPLGNAAGWVGGQRCLHVQRSAATRSLIGARVVE
jgi:hypothetical protein